MGYGGIKRYFSSIQKASDILHGHALHVSLRVVPKKVHLKAKKIFKTTEEILEPGAKTVSKFHHVETVATMEQERLMLALALEPQGGGGRGCYWALPGHPVPGQEEGDGGPGSGQVCAKENPSQ